MRMTSGTSRGVIFKGAEVFERSRDVDIVLFDKTGTLTNGVMTLTDVVADGDEDRLLLLAGSVEAASEHPIGRAVALGAGGVDRQDLLAGAQGDALDGREKGVDGLRALIVGHVWAGSLGVAIWGAGS